MILTRPIARILRPGALDLAALREILPDVSPARTTPPRIDLEHSPGMDARHYAPRAPLLLALTGDDARRLARELSSSGKRVGLVVRSPPGGSPAGVMVRELPDDPAGTGARSTARSTIWTTERATRLSLRACLTTKRGGR